MSAYIVDRNHILYLVVAAMHRSLGRTGNETSFRWYHAGKWNELGRSLDRATQVAQMLWDENIASVKCRYPGETTDTLPGPIGENYVIRASDFPTFAELFDAVQVLQSISCLSYQSCEHDGWKTSEANAFLEALKEAAIRALPGYEAAIWGAPDLFTWAPTKAIARRVTRV